MKIELILIHGFSMSKQSFMYQQYQQDIGGANLQAIDLPGHGDNREKIEGTLENFAYALDKSIQTDNFILCGHSMGASIVLEYQKLFPYKAKGIVLVDTAAKFLKSGDYPIGTPQLEIYTAKEALQQDRVEFYKQFIPLMFREYPNKNLNELLTAEMLKADLDTVLQSLDSFSNMDFRGILPNLQMPIAIMHGRHDKLYPLKAAEYIYKKTRRSRLIVFKNSGHCPHIEESERFNKELAKFVQYVEDEENRSRYKHLWEPIPWR